MSSILNKLSSEPVGLHFSIVLLNSLVGPKAKWYTPLPRNAVPADSED